MIQASRDNDSEPSPTLANEKESLTTGSEKEVKGVDGHGSGVQ